jgi:hypothetical protein
MYNTDFIVKYHDIEEELLNKINTDKDKDKELDYTSDDVKLICDKLYQDELLSVFNIDNILDDKFDLIINDLFKIMVNNSEFVSIIEQGKQFFSGMDDFYNDINNNILIKEINTESESNNNNLILFFTVLFNQEIFYLTHKCICQMIQTNKIDNDLLVELKEKSRLMFE